MRQRQRKLVGIFAILLLLVFYSGLAIGVFGWLLATSPVAVQLAYFAVAGFGWAIPAGLIIKWMQAPDAGSASQQ